MKQDEIIYKNILENMSDGVMTIGLDGRIITFNEAAERILNLKGTEIVNRLFGKVFLDGEGNDEFNQAILSAIYNASVSENNTVSYRTEDKTLTLSVTTSFLPSTEGGEKKNVAVIVVFSDRTEIEVLRQKESELNEEIKAQHQALQKSYLELEDSNVLLKAALKKVHIIRIAATALIILLFVSIGIVTWIKSSPGKSEGIFFKKKDGAPATYVVVPRTLTDSISLKGNLKPIAVVNVTSPFTGTVKEKLFQYGETVAKGQVLLRMDVTDTESKYRDAKAAFIKASEKYQEVMNWQKSDDMLKEARSLAKAKRTFQETEALYKKGIVSSNEYEDEKTNYENELQTYKTTKAKGEGENLTLAKLEYDNAKAKLIELQSQLRGAIVSAPVYGTVIRTGLADKDKKEKVIEKGASFNQGELLVSIGDTSGLSVTASVDEMEVTKIKKGQEVVITGEAYPDISLKGTVNYISSQANVKAGDGDGSKVATFDIGIAVASLPPEAASMVRLGMSSKLSILILNKPDAILVPINAVRTEGNDHVVTVIDKKTRERRTVKVDTGITTLDSVEVIKGLSRGDEVALD
jgi:PAS domain S-box-containing protein